MVGFVGNVGFVKFAELGSVESQPNNLETFVHEIDAVGSAVNAGNLAVYTFSDVDFGDPDPDRLLIATFAWRATTARTISSVTIGGVTAAAVVESRNTQTGVTSATIRAAMVPDGSSGDVVITLSGAADRCGLSLFRVLGADSAAAYVTLTDTAGNNPQTMDVTIPAAEYGFAIGVAYSCGGNNQMLSSAFAETEDDGLPELLECVTTSGATAWNGLTEAVDTNMETGGASAIQAMAVAGWRFKKDQFPVTLTEGLTVSRVNQLGFSGMGVSNGTDTGQNSRLSFFNESGAKLTKVQVNYSNFYADATNESDGANNINVRAALEYPAGVYTPLLFSTSRDVVIAPGEIVVSDELEIDIPQDAQFWIRTYVTVTSGQTWPRGYLINSARGEASDSGTSTSDLTTSGTPASTGGAYGPVGIVATEFEGYPIPMAFASVGDSILMGAGDGNYDARGNTSWNGRAAMNLVPNINVALTGTRADFNQPADFVRRLELLKAAKVTHVLCDYGNNDIAAGRSLAQMQADLTAIWNMFDAEGISVIHATALPRSASTDGWETLENQTVNGGGFSGGAASVRAQFNNWIRTLPSPLVGYVEAADAVESARDSGLWAVRNDWADSALTNDGIHPNVTSTANSQGGHYLLRDVLIPKLKTLRQG